LLLDHACGDGITPDESVVYEAKARQLARKYRYGSRMIYQGRRVFDSH